MREKMEKNPEYKNATQEKGNYSIHTLEWSIRLERYDRDFLMSRLKDYCDYCNRKYYLEKGDREYRRWVFDVGKAQGINCCAIEEVGEIGFLIYYLILRVNVRRLLGIKIHPFICAAPPDLLNVVLERLVAECQEAGISAQIITEGYVRRIDYCANINLGSEKYTEYYLKLLKKGRIPYYMTVAGSYDKRQKRWIPYANSHTVFCDSYEFSIYSKYRQMEEQERLYDMEEITAARGQLRIELRIRRRKANYLYKKYELKKEVDYIEQASILAKREIETILRRMYGIGDFYKREKVISVIENSRYQKRTKAEMIEFSKKSSGAGGVTAAIEEAEIRGMLERFNALRISPVCIPVRWDVKILKNPIYYLKYHSMSNESDTEMI